uniref:Glycosyltransferase family 92 protein n=1 Tax=Panagrellus redivivus TaxID=6233 RepID=A0A7E4UPE5_PANRE
MIRPSFVNFLKRLIKPLAVGTLWIVFTYAVVVFNVFGIGPEPQIAAEVVVSEELMVVQTGFYYNTSIFYPDNTAVLLHFADHRQNSTEWTCTSRNATTTLDSDALVRRAADFAEHCYWMAHIVTCPTVLNPTEFQLTVLNSTSKIGLTLEEPSRKPRGVVACYAPMYFEQRWQTVSMIHELNAGWGVDLQVHYVQSVVGDLMKLLQPMVDKGLLEFRGLDIPDFGIDLTRKLGYNPAQATEARHQVMALQDCFFRYRESAEFILISDPDDLFLPHHGKTLYDEFSYWKNLHPTMSAFMIPRRGSHMTTASRLENFDVGETLKTLHISEDAGVGKSVYNPRFTETPWIHWPALNITPYMRISNNDSWGVHLGYFYDKAPGKRADLKNVAEYVDISRFNQSIVDYKKASLEIDDLASHKLDYKDLIGTCRRRLHALHALPKMVTYTVPCTTTTSCRFPQRDVNCNIAVRKYRTECLPFNRLCALIPETVLADFVKRKNGCAWGIKA